MNNKAGICSPRGFKASGIHCGIRKNSDKKDLAIIYSEVLANAAAVYTQNKVVGAPIIVTKKNLENFNAQAIIVNSGNANTCNADGEEKAQAMCNLCANELNINESDVIVASTGVIGQVLDITPIENNISNLVKNLSTNGSIDASNAILTTDTVIKECTKVFNIDNKTVTVSAIAKGSGMIHPNMATMLCFLTTDVNITPNLLANALTKACDDTFNMVSVDGDTSTNDMACILANGLACNKEISDENSHEYNLFFSALMEVLTDISKKIASDGEGATKLLECNVFGANNIKNAKIVAKSVITSSLVKSAMFGEDANWGRILCAIGYSGANFDINKVSVSLKSNNLELFVCKNGAGVNFCENTASKILKDKEVIINVFLNDGTKNATAWGCDLTYDYVKINGDYRT